MLDLWTDDFLRRFGGGGNNDDGDGSAREQQERQSPTAMSSSSSSQAGTSSSRRCESGAFLAGDEEYEGCRSEVCRYCHAMERILLWDSNFFINMILIIALSMSMW